MTIDNEMDEQDALEVARLAFERAIGASGVETQTSQVGNQTFLKFIVGRDAPLFTYALREAQRALPSQNPFKGKLRLDAHPAHSFPESLEANALLTLLTRSTRQVSEGESTARGFSVPYVPFQKREDHYLAQPATHVVLGRRGVGKSTLIRRAVELLRESPALVVVLDMQGYSTLDGEDLYQEVVHDVAQGLADAADDVRVQHDLELDATGLVEIAENVLSGEVTASRAAPSFKRVLRKLTRVTQNDAYVFLDDFHLVDAASQPELLHLLHAALKGARGWLKVAGLRSLLNTYSPSGRKGLQSPGDAQQLSLDLTLENPEAAEAHLRAILNQFVNAVGYNLTTSILSASAFRRLVWANAGVPRDFLQMFARALEHAQRNRHASVTLTDVNIAIGEFGQQKLDDLEQDARNEAGVLRLMLEALEHFCIRDNGVNAFLVRSEESVERRLVHVLSDLRMVHVIHQSITPKRAGERYEAFIMDYSIFTGFRRRRNIKEMLPADSQFKASELRPLPKVNPGFFDQKAEERTE